MKIICIGRNYLDHVKEMSSPLPQDPVFFLKPDTALVKNNKPFYYPHFSAEIHYETEIIFKICKVGKNIQEKFAHRYFEEIGLGIDFTARDLQRKCIEKGLPWEISKGFDNSAPVSKFIKKDKFSDLQNISFRLDINGKSVQMGNTKDMIFTFPRLISHVSQFITLQTGDIFFTGTPVGVGPVKISDQLRAYIKDELMLDFRIK
ncbi:MAG: fumarylacetoacetate hydrolase family protein [Bacteroidia bacterium]|nr:fumarylacetoacetate hydrolase family protein [Bacteroidia bacterium]